MTELTLSITDSQTVDANNLTDLNSALQAFTDAHESGDPVTVQSGSLRWRDDGVWVQATLALPTTPRDVDTDKQALAQLAVDTGLVADTETALEAVNVA